VSWALYTVLGAPLVVGILRYSAAGDLRGREPCSLEAYRSALR